MSRNKSLMPVPVSPCAFVTGQVTAFTVEPSTQMPANWGGSLFNSLSHYFLLFKKVGDSTIFEITIEEKKFARGWRFSQANSGIVDGHNGNKKYYSYIAALTPDQKTMFLKIECLSAYIIPNAGRVSMNQYSYFNYALEAIYNEKAYVSQDPSVGIGVENGTQPP